MYSFIKGEYGYEHEILVLEKVEAQELSYPEVGYDNLFEVEENSFWTRHRNECIRSVLEAYPSKALVDVGGGNGYVVWYLQKKGYDATLLEPSMKGCLNAQRRGVKKIICGLLKKEYIKEHSLEGVCLFDVLEHIEDDRAFLEDIQSRMQINGRLYLTVPACSKLWSIEDEEAGHYRRYEQNQINKLLMECGFEVEFSNYFFSFLVMPIWFVRVIGGRLNKHSNNSLKSSKKTIKEHEGYYSKLKGIVDYFSKKELKSLKIKALKMGSSLIVVARVSKEACSK